jgi:hypothetical protein
LENIGKSGVVDLLWKRKWFYINNLITD